MNRARRRALLDAHWMLVQTPQRDCDRCGCDLDGEAYHGQTLACAGMMCCRTCAVEVVDDATARPTMECAPISDEEAAMRLRSQGEMRLA